MMSVKKPGSNVKTPAIIRKILSSIFILVLKYPVNPTDTQVIPIIAVIIFGITVIPGLIIINSGLKTNIYGIKKAPIANLVACNPVFIGSDLATPAAATAARHTGGVTSAMIPK